MAFIYDLTDTWNAGGTTFNAIKMNVTDSASAAASKLVTLQVGGSERFGVRKDGQGYFAGNVGIGTSSPTSELDVFKAKTGIVKVSVGNNVGAANDGARFNLNYSGTSIGSYGYVWDGGAFNNALDYYSTLAITQQGTERMRITSAGNVGIGTSSPGAKFTVSTNTATAGMEETLSLTNTVDSNLFIRISGTANSDKKATIGPSTSTSLVFNTADTERMRINSSGNVGIGTTAPDAKLHVSFSPPVSVPALGSGAGALALGPAANYGMLLGTTSSGNGYIQQQRFDATSTVYPLLLQPNGGNVGIGTSSPAVKLQIADPSGAELFLNTTTSGNVGITANTVAGGVAFLDLITASGLNRIIGGAGGTSNLGFYTSSTERMRIDASGNVGIGTSSLAGLGRFTIVGGGAGAGPLSFDTDSVRADIQSYSSKPLAINRQGNDTLLNEGGGNVGIGTASPAVKVDIAGAATTQLRVQMAGQADVRLISDTGTGIVGTYTNSPFSINTNGTNVATFTAVGNVGIGTSSPAVKLDVSGGGIRGQALDATGSPALFTTAGGTVLSYNGAGVGVLRAYSNSSGAAGVLTFNASGSENMRITSAGNVGIGTSAPTQRLTVRGTASNAAAAFIADNSSGVGAYFSNVSGTATYFAAQFLTDGGVSSVGSIEVSSTATAYYTSSDARLKHDIVDAPEASSVIDAIKVRSFKWNADDSEQRYGMVAQELLEVAPEAVSVPQDEDQMMGVDYSKLVPMLIKEVQSLRARVAQLEGN